MKKASWDNEVFVLLAWAWDVTLAQELAGVRVTGLLTPDRVLQTANQWLGGTDADPITMGFVRVDREHAMTTDLRKPILLVRLIIGGDWGFVPIDGWHRLHRAAVERKGLPFYLLSDEECRQCDLRGGYWTGTQGKRRSRKEG